MEKRKSFQYRKFLEGSTAKKPLPYKSKLKSLTASTPRMLRRTSKYLETKLPSLELLYLPQLSLAMSLLE